jgi:ATP-dependent DNA ligase
MLAKAASDIPVGDGWSYEPKWDGFRVVATVGDEVALASRSDRPMVRFFPEVVSLLGGAGFGRVVVDGEIVLVRDGRLAFEELQLRLHPAESRVRRLAEEIPASVILFDLLEFEGEDLRTEPLETRRARLAALAGRVGIVPVPEHDLPMGPTSFLTPWTTDADVAREWYADEDGWGRDGIMAKRLEQPYQPGVRGWVKVKHRSTTDCVVGGYRVAKGGDGVGSLLLGLYDAAGQLHYVGHTSSFRAAERRAIMEALQPLVGGVGFGGEARSPGGPSRWTGAGSIEWVSLDPVLVCEVSFDRIEYGRFRHAATFVRWRDDRTPASCTFEQVGAEPPTWAG